MSDIRIKTFTLEDRQAYLQFVTKLTHPLIYNSLAYFNLLEDFLGVKIEVKLAMLNQSIIAALPYAKKIGNKGLVINSLPFYGSHGSVVVAADFLDPILVKNILLHELFKEAEEQGCAALTLVSSPYESDLEFYRNYQQWSCVDERVGQITNLSSLFSCEYSDLENQLLGLYDQKARNGIRKAEKTGFKIICSCEDKYLDYLYNTHFENISALGGVVKPKSFFELLFKQFIPNQDLRLYIALQDQQPVAALLNLYGYETVEYFCPVVSKDFRSYQPLSLLVREAMKEAVKLKYSSWNWGGTWLSQEGVYRFKKHLGANDHPYYYFTKIWDENLLRATKQELLEDYPYFFVVPFSALKIG